MANAQSAVFYPLTLLFLLPSISMGFLSFLFLHMFLTGVGMLVFLRRIGLKDLPALVAACVGMLAGFP